MKIEAEEIAREIIYKDNFFKQYAEIVPEIGEKLEKYVFNIRDAIISEREKVSDLEATVKLRLKELEEEIYQKRVLEQRLQCLEHEISKASEEMKSLHKLHSDIVEKLKLALDALKFYAEYESDENGYGGVNGSGLYVIRLSGYYVLDKGKTAQSVLKKIGVLNENS